MCERCGGTGIVPSVNANDAIVLSYCSCDKGFQRRYHLPAAYRDWTLDSWPGREEIKRRAKEWLTQKGRWLVLSGSVGTGKSGLMVGLYRHILDDIMAQEGGEHYLIISDPHPIQFWRAPELLEQHKSTFSNPELSSKLLEAQEVPILFLDDVGAEQETEYNANAISELLLRRHTQSLKTAITTNLTMAELAEQLSPRVVDRMREVALLITFDGASLRGRGESIKVHNTGGGTWHS